MKWKASIMQRQKETIGTSSTIPTLPPTPPIPASERFDTSIESILLYLFQTPNSSHRTLASICRNLNCVTQAARYCIDELFKEKLITTTLLSTTYISTYSVTKKGRTYVMKNKLITI